VHKGKQIVADPVATALRALAWTLAEQARADRMLSLTGLGADDLRARATDTAVLAAVLAFLEAYEPDLIACAEALGLIPAELVQAREALEA
jgi:adenine/guanine phosphoribosyltransferase-like PRPP-binding protein